MNMNINSNIERAIHDMKLGTVEASFDCFAPNGPFGFKVHQGGKNCGCSHYIVRLSFPVYVGSST